MEVKEKWWHRLVKITLICGSAICSLAAIGLSATAWSEVRTYHSFQSGHWDPSKPSYLCRVTLYSEELGASVNCGSYNKPLELFEALLAARRIADSAEFRASSEFQQGRAIQAYLGKQPEHFRYGSELSMRNVLTYGGTAVGVSVALWLLAYGLWCALLYVAHGPHVRLIR